ncbi:hypothetical protein WDR94_001412 [Citrobacter amalonaticus]|uniref:hypothetical protein n=1 Tax=Citrobacter amalonaticus TaxID=35703 RepID=UPI001906DD64|nr:hypothetical protein [Citrobacter amalonaticus]MBJ8736360.1 hypothetical protein [Citrobacter amalonaticus]
MHNEINPLDYLNENLGSYDPFSLRIMINKTYSENIEESSGLDSFNKRDFATLFHEFTHQLQNTSSIVGFQQFNAIVSIWHNTRNISYDPNDKESAILRQESQRILQGYPCNKKDEPQKRGLLDIISIENLEDILKQKYTKKKLKITYSYNKSSFELSFGIGEFYESCAEILERFFCRKIKLYDNFFESNSIPYKIGESIAKKFYPECSDYCLIVLMLTALQHASPHQIFIFLVHAYGVLKLDEKTVREQCKDHVETLIKINKEWINKTGDVIENGFPFDDPYLGDVIKFFNLTIKNNLKKRIEHPFLELDFLMTIDEYNYKEKIESIIKNSGGSIIYAKDQSGNSLCDVEKIVIGDYTSIYHNQKAWLTFIISIFLTMRNSKTISITETDHFERYKCPAFLYCNHKNKTINAAFCEATPYKYPVAIEGADNCAHQLALYKTDLRNNNNNK